MPMRCFSTDHLNNQPVHSNQAFDGRLRMTILFSSAAVVSCIFYVHAFLNFGRELHIREHFKKRTMQI
jgi:hypothetical protein